MNPRPPVGSSWMLAAGAREEWIQFYHHTALKHPPKVKCALCCPASMPEGCLWCGYASGSHCFHGLLIFEDLGALLGLDHSLPELESRALNQRNALHPSFRATESKEILRNGFPFPGTRCSLPAPDINTNKGRRTRGRALPHIASYIR